MKGAISSFPSHLAGEQSQVVVQGPPSADVYSWAGPVTVEWDPAAPTTAFGQLPFFIDYLKTSDLFDAFVADCPLVYVSGNAPKTRDVLGTTMLSMLAGHRRYGESTARLGSAPGTTSDDRAPTTRRPRRRSSSRRA